MFTFHKPRVYRSSEGCCICRAKSSSSRFTDSRKYELDSMKCFDLKYPRNGEICNACVLLVKRYKRLPQNSNRHWGHVVDARAGPGTKSSIKHRRYSTCSASREEHSSQKEATFMPPPVTVPPRPMSAGGRIGGNMTNLTELKKLPLSIHDKFSKILKKRTNPNTEVTSSLVNFRKSKTDNSVNDTAPGATFLKPHTPIIWNNKSTTLMTRSTTAITTKNKYLLMDKKKSFDEISSKQTLVNGNISTDKKGDRSRSYTRNSHATLIISEDVGGSKRRKLTKPHRIREGSVLLEMSVPFYDINRDWVERKSCCGTLFECAALPNAVLLDVAYYQLCEQHKSTQICAHSNKKNTDLNVEKEENKVETNVNKLNETNQYQQDQNKTSVSIGNMSNISPTNITYNDTIKQYLPSKLTSKFHQQHDHSKLVISSTKSTIMAPPAAPVTPQTSTSTTTETTTNNNYFINNVKAQSVNKITKMSSTSTTTTTTFATRLPHTSIMCMPTPISSFNTTSFSQSLSTPVLKKHHLFFKRQSECFPQSDMSVINNNNITTTTTNTSNINNNNNELINTTNIGLTLPLPLPIATSTTINNSYNNHTNSIDINSNVCLSTTTTLNTVMNPLKNSNNDQKNNYKNNNSNINLTSFYLPQTLTYASIAPHVSKNNQSNICNSNAKTTNISSTLNNTTLQSSPIYLAAPLTKSNNNNSSHKIKTNNTLNTVADVAAGKVMKHSLEKLNNSLAMGIGIGAGATSLLMKQNVELSSSGDSKHLLANKAYVLAAPKTVNNTNRSSCTTISAHNNTIKKSHQYNPPPLTVATLPTSSAVATINVQPTSSAGSSPSSSSNKFSDNSSDSGFDENMLDRKSTSPLQEDTERKLLSRQGVQTMFLASGVQIHGQTQNLMLTGNEVAAKLLQNRQQKQLQHQPQQMMQQHRTHNINNNAMATAKISQAVETTAANTVNNMTTATAISAHPKMRAIYHQQQKQLQQQQQHHIKTNISGTGNTTHNSIQHENGVTTIVPASSFAASSQTAAMNASLKAPSTVTITPALPSHNISVGVAATMTGTKTLNNYDTDGAIGRKIINVGNTLSANNSPIIGSVMPTTFGNSNTHLMMIHHPTQSPPNQLISPQPQKQQQTHALVRNINNTNIKNNNTNLFSNGGPTISMSMSNLNQKIILLKTTSTKCNNNNNSNNLQTSNFVCGKNAQKLHHHHQNMLNVSSSTSNLTSTSTVIAPATLATKRNQLKNN